MTTYKSVKYNFDGANLTGVAVSPTVSGISPSSYTQAQLPANITVTGTNFTSGATANFVFANGTRVASPSVSFTNSTTLVVQAPASLAGTNSDPIDIEVIAPGGGTGDNLFSIDDNPIFNTAAGTLGTITDGQRAGYSISPITAVDPEGVTVTYSKTAGSFPGGMSLNTSNGALTGTITAVGSNTTFTFTIRATAGSQTSDRQFTIVVSAPTIQAITTAGQGAFTPNFSGTIAVALVAGGGGGDGGNTGGHNGGGGGGGVVSHPSYSVSSGQAVPYFVGSGNPQSGGGNITGTGENTQWGQNTGAASTNAAILTALGGGASNTGEGGCGGGMSHSNGSGAAGVQTNSNAISAHSRQYGFGNNGGAANHSGYPHPSGGGGGAGAAGGSGGNTAAGNGGAGKDLTSVFGSGVANSGIYSGGGGGGCHSTNAGTGGSGANGGGNGANIGNSAIGNNGAANSGSGAGSDAKGGSGIILLKY